MGRRRPLRLLFNKIALRGLLSRLGHERALTRFQRDPGCFQIPDVSPDDIDPTWSPDATWAAEGGYSNYIPGTYGDFGVAFEPPTKWTLRSDLYYYEADGDQWWYPELLRARAALLVRKSPSLPAPAIHEAKQALAAAKAQGARSLELRSAVTLSEMLRDSGQLAYAETVLTRACEGIRQGAVSAE